MTEACWSNEEMARKRAAEEARLSPPKYSAEPMNDERIEGVKAIAESVMIGGYTDDPCEYWYSEAILDLIARIDELKAKVPG